MQAGLSSGQPGMRAQQAGGPGVFREDDAAVLQQGQLVLQPLQLVRVLVAPHVCQSLTPGQCCPGRIDLESHAPLGMTWVEVSEKAPLQCQGDSGSARSGTARSGSGTIRTLDFINVDFFWTPLGAARAASGSCLHAECRQSVVVILSRF